MKPITELLNRLRNKRACEHNWKLFPCSHGDKQLAHVKRCTICPIWIFHGKLRGVD